MVFTNKKNALAAVLFAGVSVMSTNAVAGASSEVLLQGFITNTTCDVTVNGGKSSLNIGTFKVADFSTVNTPVGSVPLSVSLRNCSDSVAGQLVVQGISSTAKVEDDMFVSAVNDVTGFMVKDDAGNVISNGEGPSLGPVSADTDYAFTVGMASTVTTPAAGAYNAPIVVAYIVE